MTEPKAGQRWEKGGKVFHVHFVEKGQVYGQMYRKDAETVGLFYGLCRIELADFLKEVEGATLQ